MLDMGRASNIEGERARIRKEYLLRSVAAT